MSDKKKSKSAAPKTQRVSRSKTADDSGKKPSAKTRPAGVKSKTAVAKSRKTKAEAVASPAAKRAPKTRKTISKTKEPAAKRKTRKVPVEAGIRIGEPVLDSIGDVSSGDAKTYLGDAGLMAQAETAGLDETLETAELPTAEGEKGERESAGVLGSEEGERESAGVLGSEEGERETSGEIQSPGKLERLQKILSQAGIASRRHAEEMIVAGRVMVNGQVVTTLGSKADPARDHIRVDGKLLQGAERHRYFVLNKPKGYVTTVSDPEGRQTVMEFFAKMSERLYPVGRLDYQSEGLLLMTNDGELANLLTKAGSGVEKTYLVKVAGQPTEAELDRLRDGVTIEREGAGSGRVRTAPARVRQVREGDNPWYEVVLTEGRNRELRKMFSAVGHFVEKIRRVGYGPLVLDVEPGKLRELTLDEVNELRLTAEGKLKPKRMKVERIPPAKARRATDQRVERMGAREERPRQQEFRGRSESRSGERPSGEFRPGARSEFKPRSPQFGAKSGFDKRRGEQFGARPGFDKQRGARPFSKAKPGFERQAFNAKPNFERPAINAKPNFDAKPRFERPMGKPARFGGESRPKSSAERTFPSERPAFGSRPRFERPQSGPRPRSERPAFPAHPQGEQSKPRFERRAFEGRPRREGAEPRFDRAKRRPFRAPGERPSFQRAEAPGRRFEKPPARSFGTRPSKPWTERPRTGAPEIGKDAPRGRFESRGGAKSGGLSRGGGFSKAGGKGPGFRGKSGGGKSRGFRPPGKPGGGMKRD